MEWRILGPLEVRCRQGLLAPRPRKQQILLGMLLLNANRRVSVPLLFDVLWEGRPPNSARANLQSYVTGLRRLMHDPASGVRLTTAPDSYQLRVDQGELDADVFAELATAGRDALAAGEHQLAADRLDRALALWRGEVLLGIELPAAMRPPATRLYEMRLAAMEDRFEAYLAAGRHVEVMPQLLERAEAHPTRERLHGQLMLALHRAGRSLEALAAFRELRLRLVDEVGVEPGEALQRLHRQILCQDAALAGSVWAAREPAPNHLPADAAGFSGREAQVRHMDRLLTNPTGSPVLVIAGMAGAGKTALAVHWAHRVAERFPGGQLYVNLRGYAPGPPLAPLTALTLFLCALGMPASRVPVDLDEAVGLYRTLLAQRRVLVILDNARSAEQVRPLLPGGGGCVTIVTSRDRLTGLVARDNAQRMELDLLRPEESAALLRHVLAGVIGQLSPATLGALAAACGHLPLALRIAAANIVDQPLGDVAAYVSALVADGPLGRLKVDGDTHASVRAAFGLSYRPLAPAERRLFRLLGLVPGGDFTVPVAAALASAEAQSAETMLGVLAVAHLVERHPGGRYALHDLLRDYAHDEAELTDGDDERAAAVARLCGFYLDTVDAAARVLYGQTVRIPDPDPAGRSPASLADPVFADPAAARLWLDVELANLVALIHHAARHGPRRAAWLLADWLRGYFWIRRPVAEWLATGEDGLEAATADGDLAAVAAMRLSLGQARRTIGELARADGHLNLALAASRDAGWLEGQASALGHIAISLAERGASHRAIELFHEALALHRRAGRQAGEAVILSNLGALRFHLGDLRQSTMDAEAALRHYREAGNLGGEALSLSNMGINHVFLGLRDRAWTYLTEGQRRYEQIGDRVGLALGGFGFAKLHSEVGDYEGALRHATAAADLAGDAGDAALAALCAVDVAAIRLGLRDGSDTVALCLQARAAAQAASNRYAEVWALINVARAYAAGERWAESLPYAREAVALAGRWGYRLMEGEALLSLGEIRWRTGDHTAAAGAVAAAAAGLAACGYRLGEQRARALLARVAPQAGPPPPWPEATTGMATPARTAQQDRPDG